MEEIANSNRKAYDSTDIVRIKKTNGGVLKFPQETARELDINEDTCLNFSSDGDYLYFKLQDIIGENSFPIKQYTARDGTLITLVPIRQALTQLGLNPGSIEGKYRIYPADENGWHKTNICIKKKDAG